MSVDPSVFAPRCLPSYCPPAIGIVLPPARLQPLFPYAGHLSVRWQIVRGDTVRASITELAKEFDYDLIALATPGRPGLGRRVMDSVAEGLLRASGDPVLAIPPQLVEEEQG